MKKIRLIFCFLILAACSDLNTNEKHSLDLAGPSTSTASSAENPIIKRAIQIANSFKKISKEREPEINQRFIEELIANILTSNENSPKTLKDINLFSTLKGLNMGSANEFGFNEVLDKIPEIKLSADNNQLIISIPNDNNFKKIRSLELIKKQLVETVRATVPVFEFINDPSSINETYKIKIEKETQRKIIASFISKKLSIAGVKPQYLVIYYIYDLILDLEKGLDFYKNIYSIQSSNLDIEDFVKDIINYANNSNEFSCSEILEKVGQIADLGKFLSPEGISQIGLLYNNVLRPFSINKNPTKANFDLAYNKHKHAKEKGNKLVISMDKSTLEVFENILTFLHVALRKKAIQVIQHFKEKNPKQGISELEDLKSILSYANQILPHIEEATQAKAEFDKIQALLAQSNGDEDTLRSSLMDHIIQSNSTNQGITYQEMMEELERFSNLGDASLYISEVDAQMSIGTFYFGLLSRINENFKYFDEFHLEYIQKREGGQYLDHVTDKDKTSRFKLAISGMHEKLDETSEQVFGRIKGPLEVYNPRDTLKIAANFRTLIEAFKTDVLPYIQKANKTAVQAQAEIKAKQQAFYKKVEELGSEHPNNENFINSLIKCIDANKIVDSPFSYEKITEGFDSFSKLKYPSTYLDEEAQNAVLFFINRFLCPLVILNIRDIEINLREGSSFMTIQTAYMCTPAEQSGFANMNPTQKTKELNDKVPYLSSNLMAFLYDKLSLLIRASIIKNSMNENSKDEDSMNENSKDEDSKDEDSINNQMRILERTFQAAARIYPHIKEANEKAKRAQKNKTRKNNYRSKLKDNLNPQRQDLKAQIEAMINEYKEIKIENNKLPKTYRADWSLSKKAISATIAKFNSLKKNVSSITDKENGIPRVQKLIKEAKETTEKYSNQVKEAQARETKDKEEKRALKVTTNKLKENLSQTKEKFIALNSLFDSFDEREKKELSINSTIQSLKSQASHIDSLINNLSFPDNGDFIEIKINDLAKRSDVLHELLNNLKKAFEEKLIEQQKNKKAKKPKKKKRESNDIETIRARIAREINEASTFISASYASYIKSQSQDTIEEINERIRLLEEEILPNTKEGSKKENIENEIAQLKMQLNQINYQKNTSKGFQPKFKNDEAKNDEAENDESDFEDLEGSESEEDLEIILT